MTSIISGAVFGAALLAAGVYQPAVILSQMKLENWHMLQTFLAATASSAVFAIALNKLGYMQAKPRGAARLGLFSEYDGNFIGGALQGVGMVLSGACPGTVLVQVANGTRSGFHALDGAVLGGIVWTGFLSKLVARNAKKASPPNPKLTVHAQTNIGEPAAFFGFEAFCAAVILGTMKLSPASPYAVILPAAGGLVIGLSQLFSMLTRKSMLGVSSAYEETGNYFWWLLRGADADAIPSSYNNLLFAAGVVGGSWALGTAYPALSIESKISVSPLLATAGGFLMVIGSRMAGGCTSGHGISGVSLLSTSSIITIGTSFVAGALASPLLGWVAPT